VVGVDDERRNRERIEQLVDTERQVRAVADTGFGVGTLLDCRPRSGIDGGLCVDQRRSEDGPQSRLRVFGVRAVRQVLEHLVEYSVEDCRVRCDDGRRRTLVGFRNHLCRVLGHGRGARSSSGNVASRSASASVKPTASVNDPVVRAPLTGDVSRSLSAYCPPSVRKCCDSLVMATLNGCDCKHQK
jgi:hypothetical protein